MLRDCYLDMLEFCRVENAVRHGCEPDNPTVLGAYLAMSNNIAELLDVGQNKRAIYLRVANTLLETICDTYIPRHWRTLCLDNIYQPIFAAQKHSHNECDLAELRSFNHQLNTLGKYFL